MATVAPASLVACAVGNDLPASPTLNYTQTIANSRASIIKAIAETDTPSVSVALIDRDRVIWSEAFGRIDRANNTAATTNTLFGTGSVSKMFAAIATMILVERGLVKLDAPLVDYLPAFVMASPEYTRITVRMLLSHSSGFPGTEQRGWFSSAPISGMAAQTLQTLATARLKHAPGEMSVYCNDGFTMIDLLVQAITGITYTRFVAQEVLAPLGMLRSRFGLEPFAPMSFAAGYAEGAKLPQEFANLYATGGLYSTPSEMAKLARMLLNGGEVDGVRILRAESVREMGRDQTLDQPLRPVILPDGWGLGWDGVRQGGLDAVGVRAWHKNGGSFVYSSEFFVLPDEGLALMITGASTTYGAGALAQRILLSALVERRTVAAMPRPLPSTPAPEATPRLAPPDAITGIFANYEGLILVQAAANRTVSLREWTKDGWAEPTIGLKFRNDGTFSSDVQPNTSYRAATSTGLSYLAKRRAPGPHWFFEFPYAQKVVAKAPLSAAWRARIGRRWLAVNQPAESFEFAVGKRATARSITLGVVPELTGYVVVHENEFSSDYSQIVDASISDIAAFMFLRIPGELGRDLNDVRIELKSGEEWVRLGSSVFRPVQSIPPFIAGTNAVSVGDEGYAEWRTVPVQRVLSTTGVTAWKLFDANLKLVAQGSGDAMARSATAGSRFLLYGAARSKLTVTAA